MKTLLLTAAALLTLSASAFAQSKPVLPEGSWGFLTDAPNSTPKCNPKPDIVIKAKTIVFNLENGQGRCKVIKISNKKNYLDGKLSCDWDKTLQPGEYENPDGDDNAFGIESKGENKILYNNTLYVRCQR